MNGLGRVAIIVAARMSSHRFPRKVIKPMMGIPMLGFLLRRLSTSKLTDEIILATSTKAEDSVLLRLAENEGVKTWKGSLDDVVCRFVGAANEFEIDTVVRITADCPMVDGELVDYCLQYAAKHSFDLCTTKGVFPVGLDVEIYRNKVMQKLFFSEKLNAEDREHLTLYFYNNSSEFKVISVPLEESLEMALAQKQEQEPEAVASVYTVDIPDDFLELSARIQKFNSPDFSLAELIATQR